MMPSCFAGIADGRWAVLCFLIPLFHLFFFADYGLSFVIQISRSAQIRHSVVMTNYPFTRFHRQANDTCSGCNKAKYCGSFCQHKDWENHHKTCAQLIKSTEVRMRTCFCRIRSRSNWVCFRATKIICVRKVIQFFYAGNSWTSRVQIFSGWIFKRSWRCGEVNYPVLLVALLCDRQSKLKKKKIARFSPLILHNSLLISLLTTEQCANHSVYESHLQ